MNVITAENLSKSYGEHILFQNLKLTINTNQKIALIAKNGTGKTSLLNILAGLDEPDTGSITKKKGIAIRFLSQNPNLAQNLTIEESILKSDHPLLAVIKQYENALLDPTNSKGYQKAFELMEKNNAWNFENQYKQILSKLKITNLQQKINTLSGGQQKRVALASLLIDKPDLLLLDEPTNHLDLEMIEWLENYLKTEKITLFMVTHDRYFLENVCNDILEIDQGNLYRYKGNYSYFLEKKEERINQENASVSKAKNLYKKELDWIRRMPKARGTKAKSRVDSFEVVKNKASSKRVENTVQLEINMERLGSKIIELHHVSKSFSDNTIITDFNYVFKRAERIGIIGNNGTGKSTFLNLLTGKEPASTGKIIVGETIKFGYYTQEGIKIKPQQKVIEVIREIADYIPLTKGRKITAEQLLERFLFTRKSQYNYVEKLSGGEQKRLYLCRVLIQNPNFLILDEPTNDLDIITLQILEEFLIDFKGCLLVVSHDRFFMDKIVDQLFVFKGNGVISTFPGNYSDYREAQLIKKSEYKSNKDKKKAPKKEIISKNTLSYNEQKEFVNLERQIANLEKDKANLEAKFADNTISLDIVNVESAKLQKIIEQINIKTDRWLELSLKLEE